MSTFSVSSSINLNLDFLRELEENALDALEQTADELFNEVMGGVEQVVPFKDGMLSGDNSGTSSNGKQKGSPPTVDKSNIANGEISIVHNTPYARRLYFHPEYNFHREVWQDSDGKRHGAHAHAKGRWFDDWLPGGKYESFAGDTFKKIYKGLCGL